MSSGTTSARLFAGEGEMRALCRKKGWAETPLGSVETWSPTLGTTIRTVFASPFPMALMCGEELTFIYNEAYREVLGAKHPQALGRPGDQVWSEAWDEIGPRVEQIRAGGRPVYAEDQPFFLDRASEDDFHGHPREANSWFTFSLSPVRDDEESIVAVLIVATETTERVSATRREGEARNRAERAEARLLQVFDQAPAFLAVLSGPDYIFEYVNDEYRELVGDRDLIGRPAFDALPEVQKQGFEEILDRVVETRKPFVGRETPAELARGSGPEVEQRYLDFLFYPLEEPEGTISGVIAHGHDVTEHVRARAAAERAQIEAEEANQAKTEFLRAMSHDFRTPINAILGYTELLREEIPGPLNEAQHDQLKRVRASTQHLTMLAGDVLDLARLEAGEIDLAPQRISVEEPLDEAHSIVGPLAEEHEVEVEWACIESNEDVYCRGDEDRVRQILVNLLSNAIQFTPPGGGVRVTCGTASAPEPIQAERASKEGPEGTKVPPSEERRSDGEPSVMTFVTVEDTGVGIAEEEIEKIFEPFTHGEGVSSDNRSGTGLGLTIARELAEMMDGGIRTHSSVGEGSTFTLWLPR